MTAASATSTTLRGRRLDVLACTTLALSGLIHLAVTPEHSLHTPAHGLFFALLGTLQIGWAAAYWLLPTRRVRLGGFILSGGMVLLWGLTHVVAAPFQPYPEPVDGAGLASVALEAAAMGFLLVAASPQGRAGWLPLVASAGAVSLITCLVVYGGGLVAATWIPSLASSSRFAPSSNDSEAALCGLSRPEGVHTHGAVRRIQLDHAPAGSYLVRVVTSPGPGRAENLSIEVRVLDGATRKAVTDAAVLVQAVQPETGAAIQESALQGAASIPRDYGTVLELPAAGQWHVAVLIDGPAGPAETAFDIQVTSGSGIGGQIGAYLPFGGLLLLVVAYLLFTRVRPGGDQTPPS